MKLTISFTSIHTNDNTTNTNDYNVNTSPPQVEIRVREGARREVQTYLSALDRLDEALKFFHSHVGANGSHPSLAHALQLRREAVAGLEAAFSRELTEKW